MSYDIYIGNESFNYTFNISKLFYDHMPKDEVSDRGGLHTLSGLSGKAAGDKIAACLSRIDRTRHEMWRHDAIGEPDFCKKYDAPNGWGSAIGGVIFLSLIMAACYQNPRKKLTLSC